MSESVLLFVGRPDVQMAARDALVGAGYEVVEAVSLEDARHALEVHSEEIGLFVLGLDSPTPRQTKDLLRHY